MNYRGKFLLATISAGIALYAVIGGILGTQAQQPINDVGAQIRIFESVLQHIQNDYVDEPDLEKVKNGALRGLPAGLDPYSSYLTPEQVQDFQNNKNSKKVGIGAEFSQVSSYLYVISVTKGSPADQAGIMAGDVIEYIGKKATRDISLYDAKQLILGDPGTKVDLRVLRTGTKPQTISVSRGAFQTPAAEGRIEDGKIGVVKVFSLASGESKDIRDQVQTLMKQDVQKIVLDLRGVAGGDLNEAVEVANIFIKQGNLAQVIGQEEKVLKTFAADPSKFLFGGDLAVLIDLGSAGASEAVASALLEAKRAEIVGEKSFGAGTQQELFPLSRGGGLYLTVAKWASPTGKTFLGKDRTNSGVKPTVEVKRPETPEPIEVEELVDKQDDEDQDQPSVEQPEKTTRPAPSNEDIQLKKALEILRDKAAAAKA
ncbi:MAG: S41 family peptidase [Pyrinomonadaceae bacterium]